MTGRVPMIIFKILLMFIFFENATPRINSVVRMFVFKIKKIAEFVERFYEKGWRYKTFAKFRIREGLWNGPVANAGGELYSDNFKLY